MPHKIEKKITAWRIKHDEPEIKPPQPEMVLERMCETFKRPDALRGTTYKLNHPNSEHALYVTINDVVLNQDTEHEKSAPFEMFVNSKNMDSFQWITSLTRVVSAVFRKGGDITFLIEEMKSTFDPRGGYFKGRTYMPSIVAEIGHVLERHLKHTGHIADASDEQQQLMNAILAEKEFVIRDKGGDIEFPEYAVLCSKCSVKAVVMAGGCSQCLSCGWSACG